ncbi:MAG: hypothetical protein QM820_33295 [Minicystis sp.]
MADEDVIATEAPAAEAPDHERTASAVALEELVPTPAAALPPPAAMRTARVVGVTGRKARIELRGMGQPIDATIAPEVDAEVLTDACENGDAVLVETVPGELPLVVGVLHTRRPRELKLKAGTIRDRGRRRGAAARGESGDPHSRRRRHRGGGEPHQRGVAGAVPHRGADAAAELKARSRRARTSRRERHDEQTHGASARRRPLLR